MTGFGPLQLISLGLRAPQLPRLAIDTLTHFQSRGVIRLIDGVLVDKEKDGSIHVIGDFDCDVETELPGAIAYSLFHKADGFHHVKSKVTKSSFPLDDGGDFGLSLDQLLEFADLIPASSYAFILLIEHLWALDFKDAVLRSEGEVLAHGMVSPATLMASGQFADRDPFL